MDWRKKKMAVSTTKSEKKLDPKVERLLELIVEMRRAKVPSTGAQSSN
jgi:hypothetical protein